MLFFLAILPFTLLNDFVELVLGTERRKGESGQDRFATIALLHTMKLEQA